MKDLVSRDDHQGMLAWLDESLEWARSRNRTKLVELLKLIRIEILLDMDFSEDPSSARNRATAARPALGANRSM